MDSPRGPVLIFRFFPLQVLLVTPLAVTMVEATTIKTMPLQSLFCSLHKLTPENNKNFIKYIKATRSLEGRVEWGQGGVAVNGQVPHPMGVVFSN